MPEYHLCVATNTPVTDGGGSKTFLTRFRGGLDRMTGKYCRRRCQGRYARPPGDTTIGDRRRAWANLRRNGGTPRPTLQHKIGHRRFVRRRLVKGRWVGCRGIVAPASIGASMAIGG